MTVLLENPRPAARVTMSAITPDMAAYKPEGFAWEVIRYRGAEQIVSGPAGTGKSRTCEEYLHACMEKYPGSRAAIVRKTRASIAESALVTFENFVLPTGHYLAQGPSRTGRRNYRYTNGSEIIIAGLDKPSKIMSTDFDIIYVQEAIELEESEWEALTTRLRHTAMPYRRLIGDTNPGPPSHWIKRRESRGQLHLTESSHEDNPLLYDRRKNEWTELGQEYLARLDQLTGVRKDRYRFGRWVAAEGMIYDVWEPRRHHIPRFPIPASWPQYWGVDFGYEHPFVWQAWSKDPDGRLYLHREIYFTHRLVSDHAKEIRRVLDDPTRENRDVRAPFSLITDHDAEDRATLERELKMRVTPAWKSIRPGIQAVLSRMRVDETGYPRLLFLRDSLVERDAELDDSKLPVRTVEEIESYVWKHKADGAKTEEPVDKDNHGCLVAGTLILTARGQVPIESVETGDYVMTRKGYRRVLASGRTSDNAQVYKVTTNRGTSITGTADHPVLTDRGFVPIRDLRPDDDLITQEHIWRNLSRLNGEVSYTDGTLNPQGHLIATTFARKVRAVRSAVRFCTGTCGRMRTGRYLAGTRYTTRTETRLTTAYRILRRFPRSSTGIDIYPTVGSAAQSRIGPWTVCTKPPGTGTVHRKVDTGTAVTRGVKQLTGSLKPTRAQNVEPSSSLRQSLGAVSVLTRADRRGAGEAELTIYRDHACNAERHSQSTDTLTGDFAADRVTSVTPEDQQAAVYNLTVEGAPEYVANGIIVHNCDTTRYVVCHVDGIAELKAKDVTQNIPQVERLRRIQAAQQYNRFRRR